MSRLGRLLAVKNAWTQPPFWSADSPAIWSDLSSGARESIGNDFLGYIRGAYKESGVVFACMLARQLVLSEARFLWQERAANGRPSGMFTDDQLALIDRPWPNATTGHLVSRMDQSDVLAGNYYGVVTGPDRYGPRRIRNLRPDWMKVITLSPSEDPYDPEAVIGGYVYHPTGRGVQTEPVQYTPRQVIHYTSTPDPAAQWRGMSPLTPILNEIKGDKASTKHKLKFFENGATPGLVMTYDSNVTPDQVREYAKFFTEQKAGVDNAYKTLHVGGGADPSTVGSNLRQLDFKTTQGGAETRIAAALRIHPVIVGLSEGMQGSSLNAGNFASARRLVSDGTFRPLWRGMAAAIESILEPPANADRLWYDPRDIPFLRDDAKEEAETRSRDAQTIRTLVDAGFKPETAVEAVQTGDWLVLEHTGLFSVQLQKPETGQTAAATNPQQLARLIAEGWQLVEIGEPTV